MLGTYTVYVMQLHYVGRFEVLTSDTVEFHTIHK